MKIRRILLGSVNIFAVTFVMQAAGQSRTATIEDTAGVKTDVINLRCSGAGTGFFNAQDHVGVSTSGYQVALPITHVSSIKSSGNTAEVVYLWRGKQRTITGSLNGEFTGKSDFGDFKLAAPKLRHLTFGSAPSGETNNRRYGTLHSATVLLTNGTNITFSEIQRHDSYYSTEGYIVGGTTRYNYYTDFRFIRGESLATLGFDAIRKLEFSSDRGVIVLLKNGNSATGKLSNGNGAGVDGWTGETEQGLIFLNPNSVRSIEFGESTTAPVKKYE